MRKLTVISAGLSQPSSTRLLADRLTAATQKGVEAEVTTIELRDVAVDVTNMMLMGFASPKLQSVLDAVANADALIAVTPIFTTSYSGLFKSFIDVLEPDALDGMPVLIGATGGTERHSLALDYALRPMFTYLHAVVAPTGVYAATSDWGDAEAKLGQRIERAAAAFAALVRDSDRSSRVRDPFALPPGFSPIGGFSPNS
jgi:FMN reductase